MLQSAQVLTRRDNSGQLTWLGIVAGVLDIVLLGLVVLPPAWVVQSMRLDPILPFSMVAWVAAIGIIVGSVLALSGVGGEVAHPVAMLGGTVGVVYATARILPGASLDATLAERIDEIAAEVSTWFHIVYGGGQATNNLLFLLLLALVAWIIGYFSAWAVVRERSAWWPVSVSATTLTLVLATFPNLFAYMVVQLVASMLLIGRVNQRSREARWLARGLRRAGGVGGRAFRTSLALAGVMVLLTLVAPTLLGAKSLSQQLGRADRPWETAQTEFNRLFGGLQAPDQASLSGFSRSLNLHGTFHLADTPVLKIVASKPAYWRAIVYDQYTSHGWLSTDPVDQLRLSPGSNALATADSGRTDLSQQVSVLATRGSYLVGASQPTAFDRPVLAQVYPDRAGGPADLVDALSVGPIEVGSHYTVNSKVSEATAADLRGASHAYSPGIRRRYLALPAMPNRVRQLAQQLTAAEATPYDKAVAIESYLRTLPYILDLPAPPPGQDGVDYFLFDVKTGYCDYFASAMAVMLRDVGVPARVVSGYAPGTAQDDGSFLIKDSDSHTWTEAYFPPYGWIPFEPSGGWPRVSRGQGSQSSGTPTVRPNPQPAPAAGESQPKATPTPTPSPTPDPAFPRTNPPAPSKSPIDLGVLLPVLYFIVALAGLFFIAWWLWEKDLRGLPPAVVAYVKMTRLATILGFGIRAGETPSEYATALGWSAPEAGSQSKRIASDYAQYRFGHAEPEVDRGPLRRWQFVRNALLRRVGRLGRG